MSLLSAIVGPEAVMAYRGRNIPLDKVVYDGDVDKGLVRWLESNGMDWDGFWTNDYREPAHAISAVMQDHGIPVIVDVDDYFEGVDSDNPSHSKWWYERRRLYKAMLRNADRRVASTPFLADMYDCELAPNFENPDDWDWPARPRTGDDVVLLHCGSVNRAGDYLAKEEAFREFLEVPNAKIVFMGWMPKWAQEYPVGKVIFCRWVEYEKYNRMLRWLAPDLLVSPMKQNDFNLAKSNIKWLESAMIGACFVGERWGEYERTVTDGVTGFLASNIHEWTEKLVDLALYPGLRKAAAEAAYKDVLNNWTWDAVRPMWERAVLGKGVSHGASRKRAASRSHEQRSAAAAGQELR